MKNESEHSKEQLYSISMIYEVMTAHKNQNKLSRNGSLWALAKEKQQKKKSSHPKHINNIQGVDANVIFH